MSLVANSTMEAPNTLKVGKLKTLFFTIDGIHHPQHKLQQEEAAEEEDSFFDLELITNPHFDNKENNNRPDDKKNNSTSPDEQSHNKTTKPASKNQLCFTPHGLPLAPSDFLSKRKILPIEPTSKPQSPIALLKSAPKKFPVFIFKKQKSMTPHKTEQKQPQKLQNPENRVFTFKFNGERSFSHNESILRKKNPEDSSEYPSKRFSKEVMHKYLKLIKPFYVKVSKKNSVKAKFSCELSPASSPANASVASTVKEKQGNFPVGIRVVCRHLGKSKSASAATACMAAPPLNRRDDSLLEQYDGIQGAIMHCKRSFNASRDSSSLSRSSSNSSHEETIRLSSKDSICFETKEMGIETIPLVESKE